MMMMTNIIVDFLLQESLALAEMKAAAASREIVKNLDIKHQLR